MSHHLVGIFAVAVVLLLFFTRRMTCASSSDDAALMTTTPLDKAFNEWFRDITAEFGETVNRVEVRTTEKMGRGVYALETIKEETPLLKIPRKYIICLDTVENSESAFIYQRIEKASDVLTLFILEQKAKGETSIFKPWLDVMPQDFGSPLFATDKELEMLKGNKMYEEVIAELKVWEKHYDLLSASVLEKFPEVFPDDCCTFQDYKWARHMIESRAWHLRGQQHLAPMADFFNHEPLPSMTYDTEPDERGEAFLAHHHVTPTFVEVLADRTHTQAEQVFECYGDNSNSIYLKYHGFVPDENQYDCQDVMMPDLKPQNEDPLYQMRIQYLAQLGFRGPRFCIRNRPDHFLKAANFMLVRSMTHDDFQECQTGQYASIPLPERLRMCILVPQSLAQLSFKVQTHLDAYPTTLEQDLAMLDSSEISLSQIQRWELKYISKRKTILASLLDFLRTHDKVGGRTASTSSKKKKKKKSVSKSEL
jgi:hypothetical protein